MRVVPALPTGLLLVASSVQVAHAQHLTRVSATGSTLTFFVGRARHVVRLPKSAQVDMDTVEVLDSQVVSPMSYLLLTVRGPSKRKGHGAGRCGAGLETAIVWLQLREWSLIAHDSRLVESCWKDLMTDSTLRMSDREISLDFLGHAAGSRRRALRYDLLRPDAGFTVSAAPAPPAQSPPPRTDLHGIR